MIRKYIAFTVIVAMCTVLGGCQNDGHIGWLFGVWRVAGFTVDGQPQDDPLIATTTLAFQNNIVEAVAIIDDYQSTYEVFGSWSEDGNTLTLDFTHGDDQFSPGTGVYAAPWWLQMSSDAPMSMTISGRKGDACTLTWVTPDGKTNVYELRKTW